MIATIDDPKGGTCIWCRVTTDDGVEAKFTDGLAGYLCWKHFKEAVQKRQTPRDQRPDGRPTTKASQPQ
jgi:hypothetical protein